MKKYAVFINLVFLVTLLTACSFGQKEPTFNGSRTGNDKQFLMDFSILNTSDSQNLMVNEGERIGVSFEIDKGELAIEIKKDDNKPIYVGNELVGSYTFDVVIDEGGIYTVTVSGKKAKGNVQFLVKEE